jgi:hypothetical protein
VTGISRGIPQASAAIIFQARTLPLVSRSQAVTHSPSGPVTKPSINAKHRESDFLSVSVRYFVARERGPQL